MKSPATNRVRILCVGNFTPDQVIVKLAADSRPRIPEIEAAIEIAWQSALARLGKKLFDGPMCRLESFSGGDQLTLHLSRTSYKSFIGTNFANPHFAEAFGAAALANPVGLSAALCTSDGFILFGRRNASVAYYPLRVHPFAGTLEPTENNDVFAEVRRELNEEIRMETPEISEMACIGIAEDATIRQPELIFRVATSRTRREVEQSLDAAEHTAAVAIAADEKMVRETIQDSILTPIAAATLLLWGRHRFGEKWFDAAGSAVTLPAQ